MVMPRSLSSSILSRNWSTISLLEIVPVYSRSLSERVDFPWSMCAIIEKFRMRDWSVTFLRLSSVFLKKPQYYIVKNRNSFVKRKWGRKGLFAAGWKNRGKSQRPVLMEGGRFTALP